MRSALRYIAEFPPHNLTVVGSDDGHSWWSARGGCSGPRMTHIEMDFSSKGGPAAFVGAWESAADQRPRVAPPRIVWQDENAWAKLNDQPAPSALQMAAAGPEAVGLGAPRSVGSLSPTAALALLILALAGLGLVYRRASRASTREAEPPDDGL